MIPVKIDKEVAEGALEDNAQFSLAFVSQETGPRGAGLLRLLLLAPEATSTAVTD